MDWETAKKQLLEKQSLKKEYEKTDLPYEIGKMVTDARIAKRMTQQKLAQLVGTKQPSIARLERGSYLPSLSFLQKIAKAFNTQLLPPRLEFLEEKNRLAYSNTFVVQIRPANVPYIDLRTSRPVNQKNDWRLVTHNTNWWGDRLVRGFYFRGTPPLKEEQTRYA